MPCPRPCMPSSKLFLCGGDADNPAVHVATTVFRFNPKACCCSFAGAARRTRHAHVRQSTCPSWESMLHNLNVMPKTWFCWCDIYIHRTKVTMVGIVKHTT
ncbi:unnamed protein product [Periconia digitata]|uniref:Uncharacterized protein n=1 Tax=Periconia digitata TaxID=1303443 RepID=A0A9W4UU13_9PLEO|nr:unnamed protein product [Periconia digitata]